MIKIDLDNFLIENNFKKHKKKEVYYYVKKIKGRDIFICAFKKSWFLFLNYNSELDIKINKEAIINKILKNEMKRKTTSVKNIIQLLKKEKII